jgi:hypothetical protein
LAVTVVGRVLRVVVALIPGHKGQLPAAPRFCLRNNRFRDVFGQVDIFWAVANGQFAAWDRAGEG